MHAGRWSAEGDWGHFGIAEALVVDIQQSPIRQPPIPFWLPSMWRAFRLSRTEPLRDDLPFHPYDLRKTILIYYLERVLATIQMLPRNEQGGDGARLAALSTTP